MELKLDAPGIGVAEASVVQRPAPAKSERVSPEQKVYADLLDVGMKVGLVMLVISFAVYVLGIVEPHVPLESLPQYWSMPVSEYLRQANVGTGWSWLGLVGKGDFMNFAGIAFLSAITIVCYVRILPMTLRQGEKLFTSILAVEALVLTLGASGILVAGH